MKILRKKEAALEKYLVNAIGKRGWRCLKLVPLGLTGFPDRTILMDGGRIVFVELKREGEEPELHQLKWHKRLRDLGFKVYVWDTKRQVDAFLRDTENDDKETTHW